MVARTKKPVTQIDAAEAAVVEQLVETNRMTDNVRTGFIDHVKRGDAGVDVPVVWRVDDRYGQAQAVRMLDPYSGNATKFAMVYGHTDSGWQPMRPVSDRYQPVPTAEVIDLIKERMGKKVLTETVRFDRKNTRVAVSVVIDEPVKLGNSPFDWGSRWTQHAAPRLADGKKDVWYPAIRVVNSYDASSALSVMFGLWRLVCSNGLIVPAKEGSMFATRRIHTRDEIGSVIDDIGNWNCSVSAEGVVRPLMKKKLSADAIAEIKARLPKPHQDGFAENVALGGGTAYAALCFMTYLQSHELSVSRFPRMQPLIAEVLRLAA